LGVSAKGHEDVGEEVGAVVRSAIARSHREGSKSRAGGDGASPKPSSARSREEVGVETGEVV